MINEPLTKERPARQSQPVPALLVVDDTPSIRKPLIHTLRSLVPYEIIAVTDATAALAVLSARPAHALWTALHGLAL